jgi:hypothetical protein
MESAPASPAQSARQQPISKKNRRTFMVMTQSGEVNSGRELKVYGLPIAQSIPYPLYFVHLGKGDRKGPQPLEVKPTLGSPLTASA